MLREINFDGIVGPSHNFGGLSLGNLAANNNAGRVSYPRDAALEGLAKMRANLALEVVKTGPAQGFVVRGNLRFLNAADAKEFVATAESARAHVLDSFMVKKLLSKSKTLNAVQGLTLIANGEFVTYATSMSVGDGQGMLAVLAQVLGKQAEAKHP